MPAPNIELFKSGSTATTGTAIDSGNPLDLTEVAKGTKSLPVSIDCWNDRNLALGADTATSVLFQAINGVDDASEIFDGTASNGNQPMLEARSVGASGVAGDYQTAWTPIGPANALSIGNIPANTKRIIELRLNVPSDAGDISLLNFTLRVQVA